MSLLLGHRPSLWITHKQKGPPTTQAQCGLVGANDCSREQNYKSIFYQIVEFNMTGTPNPEQIKQQLIEHVIDRRDKNGDLMFPRLRHMLVSCWGNYAWDPSVSFKVDNHFIMATPVYRGRPVTDSNIQVNNKSLFTFSVTKT
jgi:hypothetical protein